MKHIQTLIQEVISSLYSSDFIPEITRAPKPELWEYCINVFPLAKEAKLAPWVIAEAISKELEKYSEIFHDTSATGGYVNFFLADSFWIWLFATLEEPQVRQTQDTSIIVDYIGANAGKPLHIGHICTPSIGQVICNIYRHLGYRVIGDSHFGDWGGIFGKLIYWLKKILISWNTIFLSHTNELKKKYLLELWWIDYLLRIYQDVHIEISNDNNIFNSLVYSYIRQINENEWPLKLQRWWYKNILDWKDIPAFIELEEIIKIKNPWFFEQLQSEWIIFKKVEQLTRDEFKKITEWDHENIELWQIITSISITEIEKKLDILNVHATYNIWESFYEGLGLPRPNDEDYPDLEYNMKKIVKELIEKGIATDNSIASNGEDTSVGVVFPEETKLPSCILQKKDGTGLYLTSDLAAIKYRLTNGWNPSKIIYSVDVRQQLHLRQAFAIAKTAWPELIEWVELFHAYNGFIKLKEWAMSTRHGTVIFLEALIEEGFERTKVLLEEKWRVGEKSLSKSDIQAITIGAIKYSYLTQDREKDVVFDWDKALNFEGHSWPYIQYAYVRARKISDAGWANITRDDEDITLSSYDKTLIQVLSRFEEALDMTARTYKPHHLALYAYDLAWEFNSFYVHTPKILEESDKNMKAFRLALVEKTAKTLEKSLDLLGIQMPSEM